MKYYNNGNLVKDYDESINFDRMRINSNGNIIKLFGPKMEYIHTTEWVAVSWVL